MSALEEYISICCKRSLADDLFITTKQHPKLKASFSSTFMFWMLAIRDRLVDIFWIFSDFALPYDCLASLAALALIPEDKIWLLSKMTILKYFRFDDILKGCFKLFHWKVIDIMQNQKENDMDLIYWQLMIKIKIIKQKTCLPLAGTSFNGNWCSKSKCKKERTNEESLNLTSIFHCRCMFSTYIIKLTLFPIW